jgi:hypothetical protein
VAISPCSLPLRWRGVHLRLALINWTGLNFPRTLLGLGSNLLPGPPRVALGRIDSSRAPCLLIILAGQHAEPFAEDIAEIFRI